jgi:hypothetical protein
VSTGGECGGALGDVGAKGLGKGVAVDELGGHGESDRGWARAREGVKPTPCPPLSCGSGARRSRMVLGASSANARQMRPWEGRNYTAGRYRAFRPAIFDTSPGLTASPPSTTNPD